MIYHEFQGKKLSALGFGTMRLPVKPDGTIDEAQVGEMTAYAISHGVNYFDTAYPYHGGESERVIGRVLQAYPRESFYLATKYPGHQISSSYDPAELSRLDSAGRKSKVRAADQTEYSGLGDGTGSRRKTGKTG